MHHEGISFFPIGTTVYVTCTKKEKLTMITIIENCIQGNIRLVLLCPFCPRRQQAKLKRFHVLKYIS